MNERKTTALSDYCKIHRCHNCEALFGCVILELTHALTKCRLEVPPSYASAISMTSPDAQKGP